MISKLHLENFKTHRDTTIALSNLTILTGENSAGKSSILQALLLLRQTFLGGHLSKGLDLNEPLTVVGTGQDALYRLANSDKLVFEIDDGSTYRFEYAAGDALTATFLPQRKVPEASVDGLSVFGKKFQYVSSLRYGGISHFSQFDFEVKEQQQISKRLGQCEAIAHYLYTFGSEPSHNYLFDGKEYALIEQIEQWERKISPGLTIDVQKSPGGGFDVLYGYTYAGIKPITDLKAGNIGYGISHSLPVVTSLLSAEPGALILLENPEAHLHPRAQAELARLISCVAQNGVQIVVETHSDHIINGVLVAEKKFRDKQDMAGLDPKNARIYYIDKDKESQAFSKVEEVSIDENGQLTYQPDGFFDQYEKDMFALQGL